MNRACHCSGFEHCTDSSLQRGTIIISESECVIRSEDSDASLRLEIMQQPRFKLHVRRRIE
jgi:hypothetical protein